MGKRPERRLPRSQRCAYGIHSPAEERRLDERGILRSECRYCGCAIARYEWHRRWYASAVMG